MVLLDKLDNLILSYSSLWWSSGGFLSVSYGVSAQAFDRPPLLLIFLMAWSFKGEGRRRGAGGIGQEREVWR